MKAEELRELDAEELGGRLKGARRELYELRFKLAVGQQDNHREIRKARKEIARILTVVHQRRLGAVEGEPYAAEGQKGDQVGDQAVESRSAGAATADEVETAPSTPEEAEPQDAETAAASGPAEGEPSAARDRDEQADVEAGRQRRRRGRKAGNEDEG